MEKLAIKYVFKKMRHLGSQGYQVKKDQAYAELHARHVGDLYLTDKKNAPIVYVVHGGGWSGRSKEDTTHISESLASHGLNVFNINYRLAPEFNFPAPQEDLNMAISFIENNYNDTIAIEKRALWGYSAGAHISMLHALNKANKIHAIVAGGGPYDLTWWPKSPIVTPYLGYKMDENIKGWLEASPIAHLNENAPKMFLYHGIKDRLVEHSQSSSFASKAKLKNISVEMYSVPFWGHINTFLFSKKAVVMGVNFLVKNLA